MKHVLAILVLGCMIHATAEAVVVGNPCEAVGRGEVVFGLGSERFEDRFEGDLVRSQRYLAKLTYGVADRVDVFARLGTGSLNVIPEVASSSSEFSGDAQLAFGGGLRAETGKSPKLWGCRFFASLQWLEFDSEGEFLREETYKDYTWEERIATAYAWREIGAAAGVSRAFEKMSVYGGVAFTRISGQVDREQFVLSEERLVKVGEGREEFSQGPGTGLFFGLDYGLSGALMVNAEYQMNDRRHGSLFIGISEKME